MMFVYEPLRFGTSQFRVLGENGTARIFYVYMNFVANVNRFNDVYLNCCEDTYATLTTPYDVFPFIYLSVLQKMKS